MATISQALLIAFDHHQRGEMAEAEAIYRQILEQQPEHADVLHRLGVLKLQTGRLDEAVTLFERSLAANPRDAQVAGNLGAALSTAGRHEEARAVLEQSIRLDPTHAPTHCNLGIALYSLGRLEEAMASYRQCLRLQGDYGAAHGNLGVALQDLGRLDESRQSFERARELAPEQAMSHFHMGIALKNLGQLPASLESFDRALQIEPQHREALCARATVLLGMGDFAAGWPALEYRVGCAQFDTLAFEQPLWDGSPLGERTLLVHCEQGLGDTLQFIRYVNLARQRGQRIIVASQPALLPLLEQSGFTGLVSRKDPLPAFDVHAPLMSLPHVFHTTEATIPRDVPYLTADARRVARWRAELKKYGGLKVGIAWQGRQQFRGDLLRSIPLASFAALARVAGVRLLSLQKGFGSEQLAGVADRFEVIDLARELDNTGGAFMDTAAVMKSLDLVITSDTAVAHLAGALGVRVWVALAHAPDWRWMMDRADSPWYPTARLFRQPQQGDWAGVFAGMACELEQMV